MTTRHLLQLYLAEGVGPATLRRALQRPEGARIVTAELAGPELGRLGATLGLSPRSMQSAAELETEAQALVDELRRHDCRVLSWVDPEYPATLRLRLASEAPPVLFARGDLQILGEPTVGICGSRAASEGALDAARAISLELATAGIVVASGNARGIDSAAHRAALEAGAATIFVTPEGILRFHPRPEVRDFVDRGRWLALSEVPPRASWLAHNAMKRNRILCGLSGAVVLVESGSSGGTFEAGRTALEMGVRLFAVEYAAPAAGATGNAYFLARGAQALRRSASGEPKIRPILTALAGDGSRTPAQATLQLA